MDLSATDLGALTAIALLLAERVWTWLKGRGVDLQKMAQESTATHTRTQASLKILETLHTRHEHPDAFGFGSTETNRLIQTQIDTTQRLLQAVVELTAEIRLERELRKHK